VCDSTRRFAQSLIGYVHAKALEKIILFSQSIIIQKWSLLINPLENADAKIAISQNVNRMSERLICHYSLRAECSCDEEA